MIIFRREVGRSAAYTDYGCKMVNGQITTLFVASSAAAAGPPTIMMLLVVTERATG